MARMRYVAAALYGLAATAAIAQGGAELGWGAEVRTFVPSDRRVRDALGGTWISYGIKPIVIKYKDGLRLSTDLALISRQSGGNKVAILRGSVGVEQQFGNSDSPMVPFAALRAGPAYFDYSIRSGGAYNSDKQVSWGGNVEVGVLIKRNLRVSARYDVFSKVGGYNFSGFSFGVGYRIGRF